MSDETTLTQIHRNRVMQLVYVVGPMVYPIWYTAMLATGNATMLEHGAAAVLLFVFCAFHSMRRMSYD